MDRLYRYDTLTGEIAYSPVEITLDPHTLEPMKLRGNYVTVNDNVWNEVDEGCVLIRHEDGTVTIKDDIRGIYYNKLNGNEVKVTSLNDSSNLDLLTSSTPPSNYESVFNELLNEWEPKKVDKRDRQIALLKYLRFLSIIHDLSVVLDENIESLGYDEFYKIIEAVTNHKDLNDHLTKLDDEIARLMP